MERNFLYKPAMFLYKKVCIKKLPFFNGRQVEADLIQLNPGESPEWIKTEYYVRKLSCFLMIILVGALFAVMARVNARANVLLREGAILQRGEPGEEEKQIAVRADYGEESMDFRIELSPRQPGEEEAYRRMEELREMLPRIILNRNESLAQVSTDLLLCEQYESFPVRVEWESSNPGIVDEAGKVNPVDEPAEIVLKAILCCGAYSREKEIYITVLPEVLSEEEKLQRDLEKYLVDTEEACREEQNWQLPESWNGEKIEWSQKNEDKSLLLWTGSLATAVLIYFFSDWDLHKKLEERKRVLGEEYPNLVHELVLLVGAGMTTKGAFLKMAGDYEKKKKAGGKTLAAYEEVLRTCREMQSGVAEGAAYERFGRRTGLHQYIRLSGLLTQNLKRGNHSLPERLREEAYKAGEERLQQCKKLGEEAGTKLLVPMVMMLAVIMFLIMIPAFSTL